MRFRAFITMLLATTVLVASPQAARSAGDPVDGSAPRAMVDVIGTADPVTGEVARVAATERSASTDEPPAPTDDETTRPTINEFYPEERQLSDCLSSLPKPGCGSDARGGWTQTVVFLAILAALAFIAWRIVVGSRRARRTADDS